MELTRESESEKSRGAYMKLFHLQEGGLIEYKPRWILLKCLTSKLGTKIRKVLKHNRSMSCIQEGCLIE